MDGKPDRPKTQHGSRQEMRGLTSIQCTFFTIQYFPSLSRFGRLLACLEHCHSLVLSYVAPSTPLDGSDVRSALIIVVIFTSHCTQKLDTPFFAHQTIPLAYPQASCTLALLLISSSLLSPFSHMPQNCKCPGYRFNTVIHCTSLPTPLHHPHYTSP